MHKYAVMVIASFVISTYAQAQSNVIMKCQGDISKSMDNRPLETQPASVSLNINPANGFVEVDGWWGCLGNLGQSDAIKNSGNNNCSGKLPMTVKDSEFIYFAKSDGPLYKGEVFLKINRINGALKVMSSGWSKPGSPAIWKFMMYQSDMQCSVAQKLF